MLKTITLFSSLLFMFIAISCDDDERISTPIVNPSEPNENSEMPCLNEDFVYAEQTGCGENVYPNPEISEYILPLHPGTEFSTGLTNCSSSFHSAGNPDQHAFDFDLPTGTEFIAARAGRVAKVVEDQSDFGGDGVGNYLVINHGDGSYGLYYHSPKNGIEVEEGQQVSQGQVLGLIGQSGYAGYPHLHFIVTQFGYEYPYTGEFISFSNVVPTTVVLQSYTSYSVCEE